MKTILKSFPAVGGPKKPVMGGDGFEAGPTKAGEYLVSYCGKHRSRRYPNWSSVPWGTPLKEVKDDAGKSTLMVQLDGGWKKLSIYTPVTKEEIVAFNEELRGVRGLPSTWVFNDFGHLTCYIYKDLNKNGRKDRTERIEGQFFHTTPDGEAAAELKADYKLTESHGCVHLKPADIDEMTKKGYMRRGTPVTVHRYEETTVRFPQPSKRVDPPFELHFYPGLRKLVVVGRTK